MAPNQDIACGAGARQQRSGVEVVQAVLPLVPPHLQIHVHDVVVDDCHAGHAVGDGECALFVAGPVVPHDTDAAAEVLDAEALRIPVGAEFRRGPR